MRDEIVHKPITAQLSIAARPRVSPTQRGERREEEGIQRESAKAFLEMLHQKCQTVPTLTALPQGSGQAASQSSASAWDSAKPQAAPRRAKAGRTSEGTHRRPAR